MTDLRDMTTGEAEAWRAGFDAAREQAARRCEELAPTITPQSSLVTQGRAMEAVVCAAAIRAMDAATLGVGDE